MSLPDPTPMIDGQPADVSRFVHYDAHAPMSTRTRDWSTEPPADPYADLQRVADLLKTARATGDQYRAATDRLREAMGMSSDELAQLRTQIRALSEPTNPTKETHDGNH